MFRCNLRLIVYSNCTAIGYFLYMLNNAVYCTLVELIIIIPKFVNGCKINDACVVSDLGIEIDSSLKYDAHINKIVGKAYSRIGVLSKDFQLDMFHS